MTWSLVVECFVKAVAFGLGFRKGQYLRDPWNVLDVVIVLASVSASTIPGAKDLATVRMLRVRRLPPHHGGGGGQNQSNDPRQQPAQPPIRQLLGAADAQTAHPATFSTAPTHQLLGSANAEMTPAAAPAAAVDRK